MRPRNRTPHKNQRMRGSDETTWGIHAVAAGCGVKGRVLLVYNWLQYLVDGD
jgi:hypothetical protein